MGTLELQCLRCGILIFYFQISSFVLLIIMEMVSVMMQITILDVILTAETAVDLVSTWNIVQNVYVSLNKLFLLVAKGITEMGIVMMV